MNSGGEFLRPLRIPFSFTARKSLLSPMLLCY